MFTWTYACGGQKASGPVELQLQAVVNFRVCAGNCSQVLCKSRQGLLTHEPSIYPNPFLYFSFQNFNSNYLVLWTVSDKLKLS